ncbi:DUF5317 domain-containing protein [Litchfieldia alkalitelluris]|uniref:DUF5317 domain-containing protein n=1 Tax=Litchfieldia alkalitelluris TaxID=304268 RepID=UPI000996B5BB|nr:DUF5317 domain-containing protein [Litchfieldia alkalitelluris]
MVFDGIIIAVIVAFFRKGNLRGLSTLKLKSGWVFPLLLLIQIFIFTFQNKITLLGIMSNYMFILIYIVGMFFLWINRHYKGFTIILIGVFLNFLVMAVNGGRMPVSLDAASILDPMYAEALKTSLYGKHTAIIESTKLAFLGDIIPLSAPYPKQQVISIGDVVMNFGIFLFIQYIMVDFNKKQTTTNSSALLKGGETV